jgi:hypothetical protein
MITGNPGRDHVKITEHASHHAVRGAGSGTRGQHAHCPLILLTPTPQ